MELQQLRQSSVTLEEEIRTKFGQLGEARKARELLLGEVEKARAETERLTKQRNFLAEELASLQLGAAVTKSGSEELGVIAMEHHAEVGRNKAESELLRSILAAQNASKAAVEGDISSLQVHYTDRVPIRYPASGVALPCLIVLIEVVDVFVFLLGHYSKKLNQPAHPSNKNKRYSNPSSGRWSKPWLTTKPPLTNVMPLWPS